jgi:hypothetical protein
MVNTFPESSTGPQRHEEASAVLKGFSFFVFFFMFLGVGRALRQGSAPAIE